MMAIQAQTASGLAQVFSVGRNFHILFSYGVAVALKKSTRGPGLSYDAVWRDQTPTSDTTDGHIKKFADGRRIESLPTTAFQLMLHLDTLRALEQELLTGLDTSQATPGKAPAPPPSRGGEEGTP